MRVVLNSSSNMSLSNRGPSSLRISLQRFGRIHRPVYRIVAKSRYSSRDGKFHEILGTYDPIPDMHGNKQVSLKIDRIKHWMMVGAEPSERVAKLLGIAEVLPPAPRRVPPRVPFDVLFPREEADSDAESVEGTSAADGAAASSSGAAPEQKPS
jgi:small subunit ribosomal protein S16